MLLLRLLRPHTDIPNTYMQGWRNRGGPGGPPLELEIYLVNFFENSQKKFSY